MNFNLSWTLKIVLLLSITVSATLAARRLTFRPLSAEEVYRILKEAGREDAVPQGRIVTQGIAAVSGFALGLKSGLAVPLAIGLATSNATQEFMNHINNINYTALANNLPAIQIPTIQLPTINYTALTSGLPTINYTALTSGLPTFTLPTLNTTALINLLKGSSSSGANVQYTTQEICFNSRSLNDIDDNEDEDENREADDAAYDDYDNDDDDGDGDAVAQGRQRIINIAQVNVQTPATGFEDSPDAENTDNQDNSVTSINDGDGTITNTESTTKTNNGGSVNCVVIQKPVVG